MDEIQSKARIKMFFWKRKKEQLNKIETQGRVRGAKNLGLGNSVSGITRRGLRRTWEPRGLGRVVAGPLSGVQHSFAYNGSNRGEFYRWMRDSIPIISAGVWAWVRLCSTKTSLKIEGGAAERLRAEVLLSNLDHRILETPFGRGSGLQKLTEAYFLELFTTGRFAGEAVLSADKRSIDHFRFINPYSVGWEHREEGWVPFVNIDDIPETPIVGGQKGLPETVERFDPKVFFYGTLGTDITNPAGIEPLATIPFVSEIEQMMLEDMARSSHNAGTPRLQVKIGRPPRFDFEDDQGYIDRANSFFDGLVGEFQNLEPDDNIFTWNDVEVAVVGGSGKQWEWRLNRDQVVEDVITGLKLFPWVLGRTHKTTQNWVQSQFDFLMQMVETHQHSGADLIDWLCNLELQLQGVNATCAYSFSHHPDPFRLERVQAEKTEIENTELLVEKGYISKEEGIKRLGL